MDVPRRAEELSAAWLGSVLPQVVSPSTSMRWQIIGADRGMTGQIARIHLEDPNTEAKTLIAKFPDVEGDMERAAREVRFYQELAPRCGVRLPRPLWLHSDPTRRHVVLLLEDVPGDAANVLVPCDVPHAQSVLSVMANMHARWWGCFDEHPPNLDWVPRFDAGQGDHDRPHRRRAQRYRTRLDPFLESYAEHIAPPLRERLESLRDGYESILDAASDLPRTLIHADLHLDNLIFQDSVAGPRVVVLDWQTVSAGPGLRDIALFLAGSLHATVAADHLDALLLFYRAQLHEHGVVELNIDTLRRQFRQMLLRVLAGFVSGYGGRMPSSLIQRERAMIEWAVSMDGLAGVVLGYCD